MAEVVKYHISSFSFQCKVGFIITTRCFHLNYELYQYVNFELKNYLATIFKHFEIIVLYRKSMIIIL
jgi:hypothetical protein